MHLPVQPLPYTRGNMVEATPIIVVDHPTDSQVLHHVQLRPELRRRGHTGFTRHWNILVSAWRCCMT